MIVFDTDTYSLLRRGQEKVVARLRAAGGVFFVTPITQAEVLAGRDRRILVADSAERLAIACQLWRAELSALIKVSVVEFNERGLSEWERLRSAKALRRVGHADLLIAACTKAHGATLVSRNVADFRQVPGLRLEDWAD